MDAVSLKSLVAEYEVPLSLIIEALNARTLHPKKIAGSTVSFESVVFDHAEVADVFKLYEWNTSRSMEAESDWQRLRSRFGAFPPAAMSAMLRLTS
jgi:hypothetical protein